MSKSIKSPQFPSTYVEGFHNKDDVLKMRYNNLGNTGFMVSHLSLGGGAFSNFYDEFDDNEAIATIRDAIKSGVNFIDTAPWYGQGRSEIIIGKALKDVPREAYYIATKVGRYETNYEDMFDFSSRKVESSFHDSLQKLGLDYVDIIQVHDIEFAPSLDIVLNETLPTLKKIQEDGKAKYIGITGYPLSVLCEAIERSDVQLHTILTYCRNSLIDTSLNNHVEFLIEKKIAIISACGLVMGLLTNNGPQKWHPASDEIKKICKNAAEYCKSENVELGRLALWHAMQHPRVSTHLVGVSNRTLLNSNLSVLRDGLSEHETNVLKIINERFFAAIKNCHWEGVEITAYRNYMKNKQ